MKYFILLFVFLLCVEAGRYIYSILDEDLTISEFRRKVLFLVLGLPYIAWGLYLLIAEVSHD